MNHLTLAAGRRLLNAESYRLFGSPLDAEQVACYVDANRIPEAHGMLDDMESRLGFECDAARAALNGST